MFSNALVSKNTASISDILDPSQINLKKAPIKSIEARIAYLEKSMGRIVSFEPFGIGEMKDEIGTAFQFQGYLVFNSGKRSPYTVNTDAGNGKDKLIGFRIF